MSARFYLLIAFLTSWFWIAGPTWAQPSTYAPGEASTELGAAKASLPLAEILRLHKERDAAVAEKKALEKETKEKQAEASAPPVDGTLDSLVFRGRVLDQGLELQATVDLTIFETDRWVELPILQLGPDVMIGSLPEIADCSVAVIDDQLTVLSRKPGRRTLQVRFLIRADVQGERRKAVLRPAPATVLTFDLDVDDNHFRLIDADGMARQKGFRFFPRNGRFDVTWQLRQERPEVKAEVEPPPASEPIIAQAHLSTVSTLEGELHHRLLYDLKLDGRQELEIGLPAGTELRKIFVNRRSTAFEIDEEAGTVRLPVEAAQAGDRYGTLELLLSSPKQTYHLSGELTVHLPSVSWPIHNFFARLSLPSVFTYRWSGGSLSPTDNVPEVRMTYDMPTPGDQMLFHQPFVQGSQPVVRVAYDIELEGQYFTGG